MTWAALVAANSGNRKMSRAELFESVAAILSAVAVGVCYTALWVVMAGPSAETLQRLLS